MATEKLDVYITQGGLELKLKPVQNVTLLFAAAQVEEQYRADGEPVDPPEYESITAGGDVELNPMTEETLEDPQDPAKTRRNKAAWAKHQAAVKRMEADKVEAQAQAMLVLGIEYEVEDDAEFEAKIKWLGQTIPTDEFDKKAFYLAHKVLTNWDLTMIMPQIQMLSAGKGVKPEMVATFRARSERAMGHQFATINKRLGVLAGVVDEPGVSGDEDSEGVEPDA